MSGVGVVLDVRELVRLEPSLMAIVGAPVPSDVLDDIGAMLASSAQARIGDTKTGPDGAAWAGWSPGYARSRRGAGGSLLERTGAMRESVQQLVEDMSVEVGSNLVYARRQNLGFNDTDSRGRKVAHPARPFLGTDDADLEQIRDIIEAHLEQRFAEVQA